MDESGGQEGNPGGKNLVETKVYVAKANLTLDALCVPCFRPFWAGITGQKTGQAPKLTRSGIQNRPRANIHSFAPYWLDMRIEKPLDFWGGRQRNEYREREGE